MPLEGLISKVRAQVLSLWNCSSSCIKVSLDHREVASYRRKSAFLLLQPGEQQKCFLKVLLLLFIVCCVIVASLGKMLIFKNGSRALIRFSQVWVAETSLFIATTCCYFINIYIYFFFIIQIYHIAYWIQVPGRHNQKKIHTKHTRKIDFWSWM